MMVNVLTSAFPARARARLGALRQVGFLGLHALVWTVAAWLAWGNLDRQGDMLENYVWGIEWQAGYMKHPPLFAWITAAWFQVFPREDVAYFALSAINAMVGLHGIVALAGRFVPRRLAIVAGLAMAVSPLYSSLAIKFNANAVLLSVWPWTAYFFVRYLQTGGWRVALASGVLAGLAMLGKYFSIVLLVALLGCALVRPVWRRRLLCPTSLWVFAAAAIVLMPHLFWLVQHHFPTFQYAEHRTGGTRSAATLRFGIYCAAQVAYLLPSLLFVVLLLRRDRGEALRQLAWCHVQPRGRVDVWCLAFAPLLVVGAVAVLMKAEMASVWGMAQWFGIVPLWLLTLARTGSAIRIQRGTPILIGYWVLVLAVSGVIGYREASRATTHGAEPSAALAATAQAMWRQRTGQAIPIVTGSPHVAEAVAFYGRDKIQYWDMAHPESTPWLTQADVAQRGALMVCREEDRRCRNDAAALSRVAPVPVALDKQWWGIAQAEHRYLIFLMLPRSSDSR